jgi:hypothetical protein
MKSAVAFVAILLALVGVAAAFFRPAAPFQVETPKMKLVEEDDHEALLDNPDVVEDPNVTPARKCGFCMGVSSVWSV